MTELDHSCLDSHQDVYISPSESEKCGAAWEGNYGVAIDCEWAVTIYLCFKKYLESADTCTYTCTRRNRIVFEKLCRTNEHKTASPQNAYRCFRAMGHYYIQEDAKFTVYRVEERLGV